MQRRFLLARFLEQVPQVEIRLHMLRIVFQGLFVAGASPISLPAAVVNRPQVAVSVRKLRIRLQGTPVGVNRLLESLGARIQLATSLEPLQCGREIGLLRRHPALGQRKRRHIVFTGGSELEVEHELTVRFQERAFVAHHHPIGALEPDPKTTQRLVEFRDSLSNPIDAPANPA